MKRLFVLFVFMVVISSQADEIKLPATLVVNGETYTDVAYRDRTATTLEFSHSAGVSKFKISQLSPEVQQLLHYDASHDIVLPSRLVLNEKDPLTGKNPVYTDVVYQSHDGAYLKFSDSSGLIRLRISKLPPEIQKQLGYSVAAEKKALEAEKATSSRLAAIALANANAAEAAHQAEIKKQAALKMALVMKFKVNRVRPEGLECWKYREITMGNPNGSGGRIAVEWEESSDSALLVDYPAEAAQDDIIKVAAYPDGIAKLDAGATTLRIYRALGTQ